ncbi:hypothetical protein [Jeongeupia chitinilytica]|uniref:Uncharacterized protein n=1 Tax=Jeongeupia chitinilytica TaxID=1041641 RepID=A0ABQ3GZ84_9NEIS|nr:hypothetical protein [Jeongeupia chitinilytica]GHD59756.1 hypothetical protein GCM10007350_11440 [Jeongeupia chitinilytica]
MQAECQVEKYERVDVEFDEAKDIDGNPDGDDRRLPAQEQWRSEKPSERFGLERETIAAESWG